MSSSVYSSIMAVKSWLPFTSRFCDEETRTNFSALTNFQSAKQVAGSLKEEFHRPNMEDKSVRLDFELFLSNWIGY
ncbi:hypothetical protein SUGI_0507150 [Cryptomeria japonica]|nr:hypothetical protein SUGI_0507150 [Cryptomeria japonica]